MKKSLMLVSFAFIFLLTLSVVSAGLWITGDVQRTVSSGANLPTSVASADDSSVSVDTRTATTPTTFTRTRTDSTARTFGAAGACPRGWNTLLAGDGGNCCRKADRGRTTGRSLFIR